MKCIFQQDGTQPRTANTDADIVNTYFRDGLTSNRSIRWSVWSRARSWPCLLTLSFVCIFFWGAFWGIASVEMVVKLRQIWREKY